MRVLSSQKYLEYEAKEAGPLLKKLVENEGFTFLDFGSVDPSTIPPRHILDGLKDVIAFFGRKQMRAVFPQRCEGIHSDECGTLVNVGATNTGSHPPFKILDRNEIRKQRVVKWLKGVSDWECIVCFEDKGTCEKSRTAKNARMACYCGAIMCFGCDLDLLLLCEPRGEFTYECPNCREGLEATGHLQMIYDVLVRTPSLEGMSEAQLALIKKYADYDGSAKALRGVRHKQKALPKRVTTNLEMELRSLKAWPKKESDFDTFAVSAKLFAKIKREIETEQRRKEAESERKSSTASGAHSFSREACANCGKAFWDKKERQRAPKCQKCSRAFYCNSKCRKTHKKKHSKLCDAKAKKRVPKKKAKRSRAKAGCAPY